VGNGERGGRCLFRLEESLDLECGEMGCVKPPGGSENATISVVFLACRDGSCLREMCVIWNGVFLGMRVFEGI